MYLLHLQAKRGFIMKKKIVGIYRVTNEINGKVFIGHSTDITRRFREYKYRKNPRNSIEEAITKYGLENFKFELIEECSIDNLNNREVYYIRKFDSMNPDHGYNNIVGGKGYKLSEYSRNKMSISRTGMVQTAKTKRKRSNKVVAISKSDLIISESGKLLGDFLGYSKDVINHAISTPFKVGDFYIYNWDYKRRCDRYNKFKEKNINLKDEYLQYLNYLNRCVETSETITAYLSYDDDINNIENGYKRSEKE